MNHSNSLRDARLRKRRATAEDVVIGQKLRALRLDRGLSQSALGDLVGVSFQQLQKYEKGVNRISAGRLARIAAALGVPVMAFYGIAARGERERGFIYLRSAGAGASCAPMRPLRNADRRPRWSCSPRRWRAAGGRRTIRAAPRNCERRACSGSIHCRIACRLKCDNHPHELSQIPGSHFFHDPGAVVLDRARAQAQLECDFLVG